MTVDNSKQIVKASESIQELLSRKGFDLFKLCDRIVDKIVPQYNRFTRCSYIIGNVFKFKVRPWVQVKSPLGVDNLLYYIFLFRG